MKYDVIICRMSFLCRCRLSLPGFSFLCSGLRFLNLSGMKSCCCVHGPCFLFLSLLSSSNLKISCLFCCFCIGLGKLLHFLFLGRFAGVGRMDFWGLRLWQEELMILERLCWCFCLCWAHLVLLRRQLLSCFFSWIVISWHHQVCQLFRLWEEVLRRIQLWEGGTQGWLIFWGCRPGHPKTHLCILQLRCRLSFLWVICKLSDGNLCCWGTLHLQQFWQFPRT